MQKILQIGTQTVWQIIGKALSSISTFLVIGLIARNYGPEATGVYTLATTYLTMFYVVVDLGLNAYVLPKLDQNSKEANNLFNLRFLWSLVVALTALLLAFVLPLGNQEFATSILIGLSTIVSASIFVSLNLIFQKNLRFDLSMISSSVGSIANLAFVAYIINFHLPVYTLFFGFMIGWLANNLVGFILVRKFYKFSLILPEKGFIKDIKTAWPIALTLVLNVIYFRVDAFILSSVRSVTEAGFYNVAFSFFQTILFIPSFIMNSYYPMIVEEVREHIKLKRQFFLAFFLMGGLGLTTLLAVYFLSPLIIHLVVGQGFEKSIESLKILSLGFPAFFMTSLLMWILVTFKRYKLILAVYALGLVLNIFLNLIFTSRYSYIATSWITVLCEYLILILQLLIIWRTKKGDASRE